MSNKNKNKSGIVYSTDPDFDFSPFSVLKSDDEESTKINDKQKLLITLDKRNRSGKAVTLIAGFIGSNDDLEALGKKIKNHCGTGGSVKDGEILIQGDQRDKVLKFLHDQGFSKAKRGN